MIFTQASTSFACDSSGVERKLIGIFSYNGRPTSWTAVRRGGFKKDKAFPITVHATYRLNSSRIIYRGRTYGLADASFCNTSPTRVLITNNIGSLEVYRNGSSPENSIVHLKQKGGPLHFTLRPSDLVN